MFRKKSLTLAYILFFCGGLFSLHLYYLGRFHHGFVYWTLFGGHLLGLFLDFFNMPTYVKDANNDEEFIANLAKKMKQNRKPPMSLIRFVGGMITGNTWSILYSSSIPEEPIFGYNLHLLKNLDIFVFALGIYAVHNIGRQKASPIWCALGAIISILLHLKFPDLSSLYPYFISFLVQWKGTSWRRTPDTDSKCKKVGILLCCITLYCGFWCSYLYFNAEVTDNSGVTIKLRDAVHNFYQSPGWKKLTQALWDLYEYAKVHGIWKTKERLIEILDPLGENHALKVMGLEDRATQKEITSQYRKLAKEFHPDRYQDPAQRNEAHQKFIEIQEAYNILSSIRNRRKSHNMKSM